MKIQRTKNAVRNIQYGAILKIYQLSVPFFLRTAVIYKLGIQYVGLSSLFTSLLSVLSLAELGVGSAMVFSMYRPIAEGDTKTICALMKLYKIYYRIIGLVILLVSIIMIPFLPELISGNIPQDINIYVLYAISVTSTVLSYWLFAYKSCLFSAHQRGDISSKISLGISTLTYVMQFIALMLYENYYFYLLAGVITQILQNIISAKVANNVYPEYRAEGVVPEEIRRNINQRVRDLFTAKLGGVVYNSVDTIVISAFLGVTILGIYNNYYYIMTSVIGFLDIIYYSCLAGIGNSIVLESKEKNFEDLKRLTFLICFLGTFCVTCFLNLYQPFMKIWMNNNERMLLSENIVALLCINFFVGQVNKVVNLYKDAAGIWHEDRFRPLVAAMVNLCLNIVLVRYIGLFGVIISTIIATIFIDCPWVISRLFKTLFNRQFMVSYIQKLLIYILVCFGVSVISYKLCGVFEITGWTGLIIRGMICMVTSFGTMVLIYHNMKEFLYVKALLVSFLKKWRSRS